MSRSGITFTAADYRDLPETAPRMELLDGEFEVTPAPSPRHQTVILNLVRVLIRHLDPKSIGKLFMAPCDVYLGEKSVLQPDVFVLLNAHLDREQADGIHGAPDLAVEVLSDSSGARDLTLKREIYRRSGVTEYWVVDPRSKTLTTFLLQRSGSPVVLREEETLSSEVLPGLKGTVRELFA